MTEYIPNKRYSHKNNRGFAKNWSYDFDSNADGTLLNVSIDMAPYSLPLIGKIGEKGMIRKSEKNADLSIANIKKNLEKR